jgi:hypothetical protein
MPGKERQNETNSKKGNCARHRWQGKGKRKLKFSEEEDGDKLRLACSEKFSSNVK